MDNLSTPKAFSPYFTLNIARGLRDFADGFIAVLLPVYLIELGMGEIEVGVVSTLTLFGSTMMTLALGLTGARLGERRLLLFASALMLATGMCFAVADAYPLILLIAFLGTINPSSGSASIFVPLEHAVISRSVNDADRTHAFARYSLIGAMAGAFGALMSASPDLLVEFDLSHLSALKIMFAAYGVLGLVAGFFYAMLPPDRLRLKNTIRHLSVRRGRSSINLRRSSVSTPLPADSWCNR